MRPIWIWKANIPTDTHLGGGVLMSCFILEAREVMKGVIGWPWIPGFVFGM